MVITVEIIEEGDSTLKIFKKRKKMESWLKENLQIPYLDSEYSRAIYPRYEVREYIFRKGMVILKRRSMYGNKVIFNGSKLARIEDVVNGYEGIPEVNECMKINNLNKIYLTDVLRAYIRNNFKVPDNILGII